VPAQPTHSSLFAREMSCDLFWFVVLRLPCSPALYMVSSLNQREPADLLTSPQPSSLVYNTARFYLCCSSEKPKMKWLQQKGSATKYWKSKRPRAHSVRAKDRLSLQVQSTKVQPAAYLSRLLSTRTRQPKQN